jgi:hypothetical protein
MNMRNALVGLALVGVMASCADKSPTAPAMTPMPLDLSGSWVGDITFQGVSAQMKWTLAQTGTSVSGPTLVSVPSGTVLMNGFLMGTLSGSALAYVISVGQGGIPTQVSCVGQLGGTMNATIGAVSTLVGSSAVTSSNCTAPFPVGALTLTRQ